MRWPWCKPRDPTPSYRPWTNREHKEYNGLFHSIGFHKDGEYPRELRAKVKEMKVTEIKQGGIYTYDTKEWGRVKVIACEREYQTATIWRCFRLDTPFGDSRHWSIVASSLQLWVDEPPKPKLITWYRPTSRLGRGDTWYTSSPWYRSKADAGLGAMEVIWEEREMPA